MAWVPDKTGKDGVVNERGSAHFGGKNERGELDDAKVGGGISLPIQPIIKWIMGLFKGGGGEGGWLAKINSGIGAVQGVKGLMRPGQAPGRTLQRTSSSPPETGASKLMEALIAAEEAKRRQGMGG